MQDLVAGQIDLLLGTPDQLPLMRAGSIKAYAVTSDARLALAPEIPTFAEMGLPALSYSAWYGLFAPKGTPKDIIGKLNAAAVEALADPAVRSRLVDLGMEIFPRDAADTGGARRACEGRCREMVADHQGVGDQGKSGAPFSPGAPSSVTASGQKLPVALQKKIWLDANSLGVTQPEWYFDARSSGLP